MENDNKCFYSISLENGITITGSNPEDVIDFLHKMHSAFFELHEHYDKRALKALDKEARNIMDNIYEAINTINNDINKERTKQ